MVSAEALSPANQSESPGTFYIDPALRGHLLDSFAFDQIESIGGAARIKGFHFGRRSPGGGRRSETRDADSRTNHEHCQIPASRLRRSMRDVRRRFRSECQAGHFAGVEHPIYRSK